MFLTHWHFDHVWGLAELVEPAFCSKWPPVDVYLPRGTVGYFQNAMGYMRDSVALHPVDPGDVIELPDSAWEVVKTNHTESRVGYIVNSRKRLAYLLDSYVPPKATVERLKGVHILVLGAFDELVLREGEERWLHFSLPEAVDFWGQVGAETCILSHLACHGYVNGEIVAGLLDSERCEFESKFDGLRFAHDGMRIQLMQG